MKTFEDLEFLPCEHGRGQQARIKFPNGYEASVLFGRGYSNGVDSYELAVLVDNHLCYETPITDDVLAYISNSDVTEAMKIIQNLPPVSEEIKERILAREKLSVNPWARSQTGLFPALERVGK